MTLTSSLVSVPDRASVLCCCCVVGDPQFSGFQGQSFQFHGLADEHFNLISTPSLQLNAHFVYLSSGKYHIHIINILCKSAFIVVA